MLSQYRLKKLTKFTSKLPTDSLLEKYKQVHQDLVIQFFVLRNQSHLLGQGLKARFGGGGGNPIKKALSKGEIDDYEDQVIWAMIDCYQAIFNLIQMNWESIKKHLPKYVGDYLKEQSLKSETTLFLEVLREHYDDHLKRCAEEGYTFTPSHAKHRAEIMRRMIGAIEKEKKMVVIGTKERKETGLPVQHKYFVLLSSLLDVCESEVKRGKQPSVYLENCWRELSRLTEIHEYWSSQHRGESRARAVKWKNGKFLIGTKGGYTSVTELN